jgi:hypothetical protein
MFRTGIGTHVSIVIDIHHHCGTVYAYFAPVERCITPAPEMIPVTVMGVIMVMPVIVVPVVIMPVVGPPGTPVCGIVTPVPG